MLSQPIKQDASFHLGEQMFRLIKRMYEKLGECVVKVQSLFDLSLNKYKFSVATHYMTRNSSEI
jgi:hypothetical protein